MLVQAPFPCFSKGCFEAGPQLLPHLESATNLKEELDVGKLLIHVSEAQKGNFHDICEHIYISMKHFSF